MAEKLFVAGVSWSTTDESFNNFFKSLGEVQECLLMREPSGRSRGFGFVSFVDEETKNKVLQQQLQLDGRKLDIKAAVSKEDIAQQKGDAPADTKKIWVAGLSFDTTDDALFNYFARFGEIEKATTIRDKLTDKSRGFGFVTFLKEETTEEVLQMKDLELDGRKLDLKLAVAKGGAVSVQPKKVYVAGMLETTTQETFEAYFAEFGTVTECYIQKDKAGKSRGFGFVTFEISSSATKAINSQHNIDGKAVDAKAAVPKNTPLRPGMGMMGAMGAMQMAAARQYQMQFQAMQAQAMQAQAQAFAARPVQATPGYPGQYASPAPAQAFGAMNPSMNPSLNSPSSMNPTMNPSMNPSMTQPNGSATQNAYDRYPSAAYPSSAGATGYPGAGPTQSYDAYGQGQSSRMQDASRGAYSVSDNVYAQQAGRSTSSANDPYAQSYGSYGDDAYQYGHARRSASRTVGYHPYTR